MRLVTYSQNSEDLMLYRALQGIENGFYVDVGAHDPTFHSVTKLFYDRGWRGVNVEPTSAGFESFQEIRTEDVNLRLVVSDRPALIQFYEVQATGLSTVSKELAESASAAGYIVNEQSIPALTLTQILRPLQPKEIHFLKIDVEGHEESVLRGIDLSIFRPWIIVVEATIPGTRIQNYQSWEPTILAADYKHVYSDGLNRFYLCNERSELAEAFRFPPNIFDGCITAEVFESRTMLEQTFKEIHASSLDSENLDLVQLSSRVAQCFRMLAGQMASELTAAKLELELIKQREVLLQTDLFESTSRCSMLEGRFRNLKGSATWILTGPFRELRRMNDNVVSWVIKNCRKANRYILRRVTGRSQR